MKQSQLNQPKNRTLVSRVKGSSINKKAVDRDNIIDIQMNEVLAKLDRVLNLQNLKRQYQNGLQNATLKNTAEGVENVPNGEELETGYKILRKNKSLTYLC